MVRIPMGNFGNAMPQVERISMPQDQSGQIIGGALQNTAQNAGQIIKQKDEAQREEEASAKRLEMYGNQLAEQEAKVTLDDVLTKDFTEQATLVKNDVANGKYDAKVANEALNAWSSEKYKTLEESIPMHARPQLKQYWDANVVRESSGLLPLQLRADAQKGILIADKTFDVATRKDRASGREYLTQNLSALSISEAEKQNLLQKYDTTRDILDIDDRIAVAIGNKDTQDLQTLVADLDAGKYGYIDGPTAQNKKNQALSRITAINTQLEVEEKKRVNEAGKVFNKYKSQVLTGRMLDDDYRNNVRDAIRGTEYEAEFDFYDKQSANFQSFSKLSTSEQQKLINQQKAKMKNSSTADAVTEEKILGVYEEFYREKVALAKSNPNQIVREVGLEVHELTPLELKTNTSDFIKKAIDNGSSQLALGDANIKLAPISAEDLPEIKKAFNEKTVDQKLSFIGGLIEQSKGMKNGRQVWGAILNQLGDGNQNYVAAGLAKQQGFKSTLGRELSTSIINGTQLLKNKQLIMPKEDNLRLKFNQYLGNTATGTDANALYQTFKAVYADTMNERSLQHDAKDEDPNSDVLKFALAFTTGGVYEQKGGFKNYAGGDVDTWRVTKPYGRTDEWFESRLSAGYEHISKSTGIPVADLENFRLQRSAKKTPKGEIQYDLLNERGQPLQIKGTYWRIKMNGVTK